MIKSISTFSLMAFATASMAVSIAPNTNTYFNADGSSFVASHIGDEYGTHMQASDGTVLYFDKPTNNYTIAAWDKVAKKVVSSGIVYGSTAQLNPGLAFAPTSPNQSLVTQDVIYQMRKANYDLLNTPAFPD